MLLQVDLDKGFFEKTFPELIARSYCRRFDQEASPPPRIRPRSQPNPRRRFRFDFVDGLRRRYISFVIYGHKPVRILPLVSDKRSRERDRPTDRRE